MLAQMWASHIKVVRLRTRGSWPLFLEVVSGGRGGAHVLVRLPARDSISQLVLVVEAMTTGYVTVERSVMAFVQFVAVDVADAVVDAVGRVQLHFRRTNQANVALSRH
jgi:hypothetical protein